MASIEVVEELPETTRGAGGFGFGGGVGFRGLWRLFWPAPLMCQGCMRLPACGAVLKRVARFGTVI